MNIAENVHLSTDVAARQVGEETMLLDLASGTYFGLDPVGARFWQLLEDGRNPAEACRTMEDEYDVDPAELQRDLEALLGKLAQNGLVHPA